MRNGYLISMGALCVLAGAARSVSAPADSPSGSAASPEQGTELVEIVITAQKRPEKLMDVPVAAQVVSTQTLANANIADLSDLNNLVPSVRLNGTINGRVPTGIRGISSVSNEQTVGISSGVAINIDGVPVPSDSFDANNVAGIERVEVLLGPQSTLGGRTAASGLINMVTRGPSDTLQGFATTTATSDGEYRVEGFLSGPLSDRVEASLSAYKFQTPYPITNLFTGEKTTQDVTGARLKFLFKVTDNLDVQIMAHDELTEGTGFNFVYSYVTPGNCLLFTPCPPFLSQAALLPGITLSRNNLVYKSPVTSAGADHRDNDYSVSTEYRLPGGYTLSTTAAFSEEKQNQTQDLFAVDGFFWQELTGQTVFFNTQTQDTTVKQHSGEVKIVSPADQRLSWLAGVFYSDTQVDENYLRTLPPAGLQVHVIPDTKTTDIYGRSTWKITSATSLVTGLRFNHDQISNNYNQYVTFPVSPAAYNTSAVLGSNAAQTPVGKESINSYELGLKGTFLDRTLSVNGAIFDT